MRECKILINDNDIQDELGIYLISSPSDVSAPIRMYETESYPEKSGVEILPYTVQEPFDYKISLAFFGDEESANLYLYLLWAGFFNNFDFDGSKMEGREIKITNLYKGVIIYGYPKSMTATGMEIIGNKAAWMFDLTFFVADPSKCNFINQIQ